MEHITGNRQWTRRAVLTGLMAGSASLVLAQRANAYDVVLAPTDPQLGDTISVTVQASPGSAPPIVTVNNSTRYPVFPLSGNRYRALIPTSPINAPGSLTIRPLAD